MADPTTPPTELKGSPPQQAQKHFTIVALETTMVPVPHPLLPPELGYTYTLHTYPVTATRADAAARIRDADIIILSVQPIPRALLDPAVSPRLKHIAVVASGTDQVDKEACRERGIVVSNTPHCNTTSVAEHVVASYFSLRRSLGLVYGFTQRGGWGGPGMMGKSSRVMNQGVLHRRGGGGGDGGGSAARGWEGDDGDVMLPPRTCEAEVLGIIGYGGVGKKVEMLAKALGMKVLISGRKGGGDDTAAAATTTTTSPPPHTPGQQPERTPFTTLLRTASVVVLCCPRSPETINLISAPELALMPPHALLINVSRGGVVDEPALLEALQAKRIAGAATDVFLTEPATPDNSVLLLGEDKTRDLNLLTTPHVAWYAEETIKAYNRALQDNLRGWLGKEGRPKYPVVWYGKDSAEQE